MKNYKSEKKEDAVKLSGDKLNMPEEDDEIQNPMRLFFSAFLHTILVIAIFVGVLILWQEGESVIQNIKNFM